MSIIGRTTWQRGEKLLPMQGQHHDPQGAIYKPRSLQNTTSYQCFHRRQQHRSRKALKWVEGEVHWQPDLPWRCHIIFIQLNTNMGSKPHIGASNNEMGGTFNPELQIAQVLHFIQDMWVAHQLIHILYLLISLFFSIILFVILPIVPFVFDFQFLR